MEFYDVVAQVLNLLQRQGRVSYRALKRQFDLADDFLEDLKEELCFAHPVRDEDGRGLVWTGETGEVPELTSPPKETTQPDMQARPTQVELPPTETRAPDAERRQLTVMFCDLVDSTRLSSELDPEDLREIVREYQRSCTDVVAKYDGHVAQLLGDGLLVYFGYPVAHEDDAQRSVHAGLEILNAIKTLNVGLEQSKGIRLAIRLGIHTGLVVIGEMGGEGRQEQLALGEVPNIASRIQGLAEPDTLVISEATYRLIQGYFDCESRGDHDLRGVSQPIAVHHVLGDTGIQSRLDVASARGLTPLVGRESEVTLLLERWEQATEGQGQVVLLSGEAGIGKSRLVQALKDHLLDQPHIRWECRSSPYFTNSALYPVIDLIQRTLRWQPDETPELKLEKLTHNLRQYRLPLEETVPLFGALLSLSVPEGRYPSLSWTPQRQRQKTLEAIIAIILELAERQPVLFILDDAHWSDPTTIEFIDLLLDQTPTASLLILITYRPEFQPTWGNRSYLSQLTLNRLSREGIEHMATRVAGGKMLPTAIVQQLVDKTDGVPLFVEEMTKTVLESGVLKDTNGQYELTGSIASLSIPATLQDSLMARLDRLVTAKAVAQYAAVIGRQFSYELLQAVSQLNETMLQHELGRLVEAELVYQRGLPPTATYTFKHALIQDTAYESLLRSTRQGYHRRIAEVLEERFPETAANQPELVARHYTAAECAEPAVSYWRRAGEHASDHSAYLEAISHFTTGIELLRTLPETPERTQQALTLHIALGTALQNAKGHAAPEVEHIYSQARALCRQVGETPQLVPVLFGLWRYYVTRSQLRTACELSETLLQLAQHTDDPALAVIAHSAQGTTCLWRGELSEARSHIEESLAHYTPEQRRAPVFRMGFDAGVAGRTYTAMLFWLRGYPEQALVHLHKGLALAHEISHPYSLAFARFWAAWVSQVRRDVAAVREYAEATVALATEQGFPLWRATGMSLHGWALAMQGQGEAGLTRIRQGIATWRATGAALFVPCFCTWLAEIADHLGCPEDGLQALAEASTLVEQHEECYWEAEVCRLRGALFLRQATPQPEEAETYFHRALDIARHQEAKSWELRAATSLAKLWQSQGKVAEAKDLLTPVYAWFTEGFDTADLIDAKALLAEFEEGR